MTVLKRVKIALLALTRGAGLVELCLNSDWRRQRLLILCYHGTSLADEHLWNPDLYMPPALLHRRLSYLRQKQCSVLPLAEGLARLYNGGLPPRSVVLTCDDGTYDFYKAALPVIREFNYPVTVYFSTYYSYDNRPVFDPMCSYLLWKARGRTLRLPEVFQAEVKLTDESFRPAAAAIRQFAAQADLSADEKDLLLHRLARDNGIDYDAIRSARLLHLMTPEEAAEAASMGVDIQLHTHRHRVYDSRNDLQEEVVENQKCVESMTGRPADHFCYPSGCHLPDFPAWLREIDIVSATTTEPGIASKSSDPMLLPRLIDTCGVSDVEFAAWISGLVSLLPHRKYEMSRSSLVRVTTHVGA